MTIKITPDCINCGACEKECPVAAISQGASQYEIDQSSCTQCEACMGCCPTGAIIKE